MQKCPPGPVNDWPICTDKPLQAPIRKPELHFAHTTAFACQLFCFLRQSPQACSDNCTSQKFPGTAFELHQLPTMSETKEIGMCSYAQLPISLPVFACLENKLPPLFGYPAKTRQALYLA